MEYTVPALPTEIIAMIMSNLCPTDLLVSRGVSKLWNEEGLKLLKKSSEIRLTEYNLERRMNHMVTLGMCDTILPVRLKIRRWNSTVDILLQDFLPKIKLSCITTLNIGHCAPVPEHLDSIMNMIMLLSKNLRRLILFDECEDTCLCANEYFGNSDIQFEHLNYLKSRKVSEDITCKFLSQIIIERSPHLKRLSLTHWGGCLCTYVPFERIDFLSFHIANVPESIQALERCSRFPTQLKLQFSNTLQFNALALFAPFLTSLTFNPINTKSSPARSNDMPPLPNLENLLHLKMFFDILISGPVFLNPLTTNFSPSFLPKLRSIELPLGLFFLCPTNGELLSVPFDNVTRLGICMRYYDTDVISRLDWLEDARAAFLRGIGDSVVKNVSHLQHMFPRATTLELDFGNKFASEYAHAFIYALLTSEGAHIVKHLEIKNLDKCNYLGEVLQHRYFLPIMTFADYQHSGCKKSINELLTATFQSYESNYEEGTSMMGRDGNLAINCFEKVVLNMINVESINLSFKYPVQYNVCYRFQSREPEIIRDKKSRLYVGAMVKAFQKLRTINLDRWAFPDDGPELLYRLERYRRKYSDCFICFL